LATVSAGSIEKYRRTNVERAASEPL